MAGAGLLQDVPKMVAMTAAIVKAIETVENSPWTSPGGGLQFTRAAWAERTGSSTNPLSAIAVVAATGSRSIRPSAALTEISQIDANDT
jgi:hypothetical protein